LSFVDQHRGLLYNSNETTAGFPHLLPKKSAKKSQQKGSD